MYNQQDDFDFGIVQFSFLNSDVRSPTYYGVYISEMICFANHLVKSVILIIAILSAHLLKQKYHCKTFSKCYPSF